MRLKLATILLWLAVSAQAQNTAEILTSSKDGLTLGGYGEVHYNQALNSDIRKNGTLDVHRMIMFLGYNFNSKTQFISEIEFEHVSEVYVEQAYLQHKLNKYVNLQAGLLLVPMGLINLYHEPTTFNGVERPVIDSKIAPTTWREIGLGLQGNILEASLKYQLYLMNGLSGYDGSTGLFSGSKTLRSGRQKGAESYISSPNISGRIQYYGLGNLNLGLSGYFGKSQSKLYDGIDRANNSLIQKADSSTVGISMLGLDYTYSSKGFESRAQLYYTSLSNTLEYNKFTGNSIKPNDLGNKMYGYYVEVGYDIFRLIEDTKLGLVPFVRYQSYDTHLGTDNNIQKNPKYAANSITTGLTLKLSQGAVVKTDIDFLKTDADSKPTVTFNAGIGVMF